MSPEFQRNLWLELTPRRLTMMAALLALAFFAAALSGGAEYGPASWARWLYYAIVVIWGARNAGMSVVGEIRDRTWDLQLLSSLSPGAMTWGKLFGATSYNWFGGFICLAVMTSDTVVHQGIATAAIDLVYFLAIGLIAQSAALLASLIAIRRRQSHSRLEIFLYQAVGLAAAIAVYWVWNAADPTGSILTRQPPTDFIAWWGRSVDARGFLLVSLAVFTGWTLTGCYREMRRELKMRNGPLVWLGFLLFIGIYVAGFDAWLSKNPAMAAWEPVALRLGLAATAFWALTYVTVFLEPKDRVHYRWLGSLMASGRIASALTNLQAWMMSYAATAASVAALIVWLGLYRPPDIAGQMLIASALGFLTRDVSIFVLMHTLPGRRRGDFAALGILLAAYVLAPAIVNGLGWKAMLILFYPQTTAPVWLGAAVAWAQAIAVAALASGRLALSERKALA